MASAQLFHRSYCYVCRSSLHSCTALLQVRYKAGWFNRIRLCASCYDWLMQVAQLARAPRP